MATYIRDQESGPLVDLQHYRRVASSFIMRQAVGNAALDCGVPVRMIFSKEELQELYPPVLPAMRTNRIGTYESDVLGGKLPLLLTEMQEQTGSRSMVIITSATIDLEDGSKILGNEIYNYPKYFCPEEIDSIDSLSSVIPKIVKFRTPPGPDMVWFNGIDIQFYLEDELDKMLVQFGSMDYVARLEIRKPFFWPRKRNKLHVGSRLPRSNHKDLVKSLCSLL